MSASGTLDLETTVKRITVYVGEQPNDVDLHQKSESIWIASGEYMGEQTEGEGSSPAAAVKRWMEMVHERG
jgi:hypothetical protein